MASSHSGATSRPTAGPSTSADEDEDTGEISAKRRKVGVTLAGGETAAVVEGEDGLFRCPVTGCTQAYSKTNSLRQHCKRQHFAAGDVSTDDDRAEIVNTARPVTILRADSTDLVHGDSILEGLHLTINTAQRLLLCVDCGCLQGKTFYGHAARWVRYIRP